jgi:RNA polymerase sigma-70 factor (ECF subfamily)
MEPAAARSAPEDCQIVELLAAGAHEQAFALLLQRYDGKVYRLCCALLRDPAQAQDVAQESLVRIWKALARYDGRAALSTWIYAITRNRCLTALSQRHASGPPGVPAEPEVPMAVASVGELEVQDQAALLRALVGRLPERFARVLVLYYYEDRAVGEVARMLAMPVGTVKTTLFRARAALLEQLRRRGLDRSEFWLESLR